MALFLNEWPENMIGRPASALSRVLESRYGADFNAVMEGECRVPGPYTSLPDTQWIKKANTVGINVRTIGSFWKIIPYALTLPEAQNAIRTGTNQLAVHSRASDHGHHIDVSLIELQKVEPQPSNTK